jgi:protein-S-isoprenylcysteine O-methyltransferase Ste14
MSWLTGALIPEACWSLVTVVWIAGAIHSSRKAPSVEDRSRRGSVPIAFVILAIIALAPLYRRTIDFGSPSLQIVGALILLPSTAFTIWSRLSLGTMWSYTAVARKDHELRTKGPYSVTRHPIYTGLIGMLLGTTLLSGQGQWVPILVAGVVLLVGKSARDEQVMASVFGQDYETYRARIPRLIPRPWRRHQV